MTAFSLLASRVEAAVVSDGILTLTKGGLGIPETDAFFTNVIQADQIVLKGASRSATATSVTVSGTTDFMAYPDVAAEVTFAASEGDGDEDTIVCTLDGTLPGTYRLPLIDWIDVARAGISVSLLQPYDVVQLAFTADLVVSSGSKAVVPIRIAQVGAGSWQCAIDTGGPHPNAGPTAVTAEDLVALLGGHALAAFLPQALVDALHDLQVIDLAAIIDPARARIQTFSLAVQVGNGWPDIVPGFGLKDLQLLLTLIDPLSASSRQTVGAVRGTLQIGDVDVPVFVQAAMSAGSTSWELGLDRDPGKYPPDGKVGVVLPTVSDVLSLVSPTAAEGLPDGLTTPQVAVTDLRVRFDTSSATSPFQSLSFAATTVSTWEVIESFFAIENVALALTVDRPASGPLLFGGQVSGTFAISEAVDLFVSVSRGPTGWTLSGGLAPGCTFDLTEIVASLLKGRLTLPSRFPDIVFTTATVSAVPGRSFLFRAGSTQPWSLVGSLSLDTFDLTVGYQGGVPSMGVQGSLSIGHATANARDLAERMRK